MLHSPECVARNLGITDHQFHVSEEELTCLPFSYGSGASVLALGRMLEEFGG